MSKGARNRRIRRYARENSKHEYSVGGNAKSLARRLRRVVGWDGKY